MGGLRAPAFPAARPLSTSSAALAWHAELLPPSSRGNLQAFAAAPPPPAAALPYPATPGSGGDSSTAAPERWRLSHRGVIIFAHRTSLCLRRFPGLLLLPVLLLLAMVRERSRVGCPPKLSRTRLDGNPKHLRHSALPRLEVHRSLVSPANEATDPQVIHMHDRHALCGCTCRVRSPTSYKNLSSSSRKYAAP